MLRSEVRRHASHLPTFAAAFVSHLAGRATLQQQRPAVLPAACGLRVRPLGWLQPRQGLPAGACGGTGSHSAAHSAAARSTSHPERQRATSRDASGLKHPFAGGEPAGHSLSLGAVQDQQWLRLGRALLGGCLRSCQRNPAPSRRWWRPCMQSSSRCGGAGACRHCAAPAAHASLT